MCCRRLAEIQDAKIAKNRHLRTIAQLCRALSSQLRHTSTIRKKHVSSNTSSICPRNMVNFGPLTAEIDWRVWGTPANFNGFRVFAFLRQRRRSSEANQSLHDVWPSPGLHIFGSSWYPDGILLGAIFIMCSSLAFSYVGSIIARHSSSRRQPKLAACYKELNYGTFAEGATCIRRGGHHVGHRPTF